MPNGTTKADFEKQKTLGVKKKMCQHLLDCFHDKLLENIGHGHSHGDPNSGQPLQTETFTGKLNKLFSPLSKNDTSPNPLVNMKANEVNDCCNDSLVTAEEKIQVD